jgi:NADH-quinone oxidoreductase subunit H
MRFGWKVLIPISLVWILVLAGLQLVRKSNLQGNLKVYVIVGIIALVAIAWVLWPAKEKPETTPGIDGVDPGGRVGGEQGFPLPPLDLQVPPSPAVKRLTAEREPVPAGAGTAESSDQEV